MEIERRRGEVKKLEMGIERRSGEVKKLEMRIERRSGEVKKLEMRISNCELKFFFLVAIADIHLCNYSSYCLSGKGEFVN
jgi:predicted nuclease with TOPRIM domain